MKINKEDMKLRGKVALVTGAGRGIGKAIAISFSREGADVVVCSRTKSELAATVEEINKFGGRGFVIVADVSDEHDVTNMLKEALKHFGTIDILVNNAGIGGPADPVNMIKVEDWDLTMKVNLRSVFLVSKTVLPIMIEKKKGKIINISSTAGKFGVAKISPYCVSKFGIIGFSQSLAKEVAEFGICVNTICPGPTETSLAETHWPLLAKNLGISIEELREKIINNTPQRRILSVDDISSVAVFLASADSDGITGEEIIVAGGYKGI